MKHTLFVASGSGELESTAACMQVCRDMGWRITCDWVAMRREEPVLLTDAHKLTIVDQLEDALIKARVVWVRLPAEKSEGAAYELGFVRGMLRVRPIVRQLLIISGPFVQGSLYPVVAKRDHAYFENHQSAIELLREMITTAKAHEVEMAKHCHAGRDGECYWERCPQEIEGGIHRQSYCPLARADDAAQANDL